jgi:hypothetical protein
LWAQHLPEIPYLEGLEGVQDLLIIRVCSEQTAIDLLPIETSFKFPNRILLHHHVEQLVPGSTDRRDVAMSVRDYGLAAPHGPNVHTDKHVATGTLEGQFAGHAMSENEESVFRSILKPDDIYDEQGRYWADLPLGQRVSFVSKVDAAETRRELNTIGRMIKKDPLSPLGAYTRNMIIPGAGLLLEGYVDHRVFRFEVS